MTDTAAGHYRPELQGLRALAVTLVVLEHAGVRWLPGGFVGVDVFFVLSGYLITGLLVREHAATGRIAYGAFLARRLRRLGPGLIAVLVVATVGAWLMLAPLEQARQTASLSYALTWTSNLFFSFKGLDYFDAPARADLFLHTWSLGVEEQFYLLWPLALMAAGAGRRSPRVLAWSFGVLALGAWTTQWLVTVPGLTAVPSGPWTFYLLPGRVWEFALGGAVWAVRDHAAPSHGARGWRRVAVSIAVPGGVLLIVAAAVGLDRSISWPGGWAALPALGTALVLAGGDRAPGAGLDHPAAVWLGDRSYALYLWHWPVFTLAATLGYGGTAADKGVLVATALVAAALSYRWVEYPLWKGRRHGALRPAFVSGALLIAISVALLGTAQYRLVVMRALERDVGLISPIAQARRDRPEIYAHGCDRWYLDAEVVPCWLGPADAPHTAVFIGDSIGMQWLPALLSAFPAPQWRVAVLTKSSCPLVDAEVFLPEINRVFTECATWRADALGFIERLRPAVVVTGSGAGYPFTAKQWTQGTRAVTIRMADAADRVVVLGGTPALGFDAPGCLARRATAPLRGWPGRHAQCRAAAAPDAAMVAAYQRTALAGLEHAYLVDPGAIACPAGICAAQDAQGRIVYRDDQHLTASFVRAQAPELARRLVALGVELPGAAGSGTAQR